MNRRLTFAIDEDGHVISRLNGIDPFKEACIAYPVLDFEDLGEDGDFTKPFTYHLEKMGIGVLSYAHGLTWTKKISFEVKNLHREFWGFEPLTPSRKNLPSKQAEILALLDDGPKTEPELAAATGRMATKAHPFLRSLESKGLATFDHEHLRWRSV